MEGYRQPEYYQMTNREFSRYLSDFHLPQKFLEGKRILDVGAGLSNFAQEANKSLADTGTVVVATDLNYDILSSENFEARAAGERNLHIVDRGEPEKMQEQESQSPQDRRSEILQEAAQKPGAYVAADRSVLPYGDGSFDLLFCHNSVFPYLNQNAKFNWEIESTISEGVRLLREDGRIYMQPTPFRTLDDGEAGSNSGIYVKLSEGRKRGMYSHGKHLEDDANPDLIERFKRLEKRGFRFYILQQEHRAPATYSEGKYVERFEWINSELIIARTPQTFTGDQFDITEKDVLRIRIVELRMSDTTSSNLTPGSVVYQTEPKLRSEHSN